MKSIDGLTECLTVKQLKDLLSDWPDEDPRTGEASEVFIATGDAESTEVRGVCPLNSTDLLLFW